eukprot:scaffold354957_cov28-Prasinocladus_malaysianus.AAC.1
MGLLTAKEPRMVNEVLPANDVVGIPDGDRDGVAQLTVGAERGHLHQPLQGKDGLVTDVGGAAHEDAPGHRGLGERRRGHVLLGRACDAPLEQHELVGDSL